MSNLYIDINKLPDFKQEYVAWVDIMGIKNIVRKNDRCPTLYILKLHKCMQLALNEFHNIDNIAYFYHPIIDGFYFTSDNKNFFLRVLIRLFVKLAYEFIETNVPGYQYMVRAGISYGSVIHGSNISGSQDELLIDEKNKNSLLFGNGLINAVEIEHTTPPFGIGIHESIAIKHKWQGWQYYEWWEKENDFPKDIFYTKVIEYYSWLNQNPCWVNYPEKDKERHKSSFMNMLNIDDELD